MAGEAGEDTDLSTVMVDGISDSISTELLLLYFESRRRSSGGPVQSHWRQGKSAMLTFENPEDAQSVLAREQHLLLNIELLVRSVPPRDPGRVLLKGLKHDVSQDVLELYVEYVTNCESGTYTLQRVPSGDEVLIEFNEPLTDADFKYVEQKVSRRLLEGLVLLVQQIPRTYQVLVSNLNPGIGADLLELYFESKRSDGGHVLSVTLLKEARAAIVTFKSWEVADRVLRRTHRLQDATLPVSAYYHFLHPPGPAEPEAPESSPESSSVTDTVESLYIDVLEPWKLEVLRRSPALAELREAFPAVVVELDQNGVRISGQELEQCQQVQGRALTTLRGAAQSHMPYGIHTLQFVVRNDVREYLEGLLGQVEPSASYTVSDLLVNVTASSLPAVKAASDVLKSALCEFTVPVPKACLHALRSAAWEELQASLCCCSVRIVNQDTVQVVCLREYEQDIQQELVDFLQERQQQDTVITMEPPMLQLLQRYNHDLLASMSEVTIEPLEGSDVTGFRILGAAGACQPAEELIRDILENTHSLPVTLEHPGIARFLLDEQGKTLLKQLEARCHCVIDTERVWWAPHETEHEFDAPLLAATQSFDRCSPDSLPLIDETPATEKPSDLEDIKAIVAAVEDDMEEILCSSPESELPPNPPDTGAQTHIELADDMDIYGDPGEPILISESKDEHSEEPTTQEPERLHLLDDDFEAEGSPAMKFDSIQAKRRSVSLTLPSTIQEKAEMHLAIQRSMDQVHQIAEEEDRELEEALKSSLLSYQNEQQQEQNHFFSDYATDMAVDNVQAALQLSVEESIRAANTANVTIYASSDQDLQSIASQLRQLIHSKLNTEKVENSCLCKLTEQYLSYVAHLQRKHAVQVSVQQGIATIHGFMAYTIYATRDIGKLINRILQEEGLKLEEAEVSKGVSWVWYDEQGREVPYSSKANAFIEHGWRQKQKLLDVILDNKPYTIDFDRMEEYSLGSSQATLIARKDAKSGVPGAGLVGMGDAKVELQVVDTASEEYRKVVRPFYDTLEKFDTKIKIVKVEKLVNPLLLSQYQLKKQSMELAGCPEPFERMLYHGTSEASAKEICQYGFNRSFCGKNATRYGRGVYFAVNSAVSVLSFYSPPNSAGNKFVFVVKTLTGEYTQGTEEMRVPPLKAGVDCLLRYDSVVDDLNKPTIYVIFNDTQAYPQYLITCCKIPRSLPIS